MLGIKREPKQQIVVGKNRMYREVPENMIFQQNGKSEKTGVPGNSRKSQHVKTNGTFEKFGGSRKFRKIMIFENIRPHIQNQMESHIHNHIKIIL